MPAVRISTISGVYAGFAHHIADLGTDGPEFFSTIWDWGVGGELAQAAWLAMPDRVHELADALAVVPDIYSFLEVFVLADGRRFVRVPDVSSFPGVSLYVDGTRQWMRPVEYTPRERINTQMSAFFTEAGTELAPYHAPAMKVYLHNLANLHPISEVTLGFEADGKPIDDPEKFLPFGFPFQFEERVPPDSG